MAPQVINERRRAKRAQRTLSLQFRVVNPRQPSAPDESAGWINSTTHDMSVIGLSFVSPKSLQVGDVIELHVVMAGILDIHKGLARVVRVDDHWNGRQHLIACEYLPK